MCLCAVRKYAYREKEELIMISPSANCEQQYDLFLSYRGLDTGDNFKSHLCSALLGSNISTFADTNLSRGEDISPSLVKAIQRSKLSVIIFSQNYAYSTWCLDEAAVIMECKRLMGQIVIPVFYRVTPSQVRYQTGSYADAFAKHKRFRYERDRIRSWRGALTQAANLAGWDSQAIRPESELIKGIVADLQTKLNRVTRNRPPNLMRIDSCIQQPQSLLRTSTPCGPRETEPDLTGELNPNHTPQLKKENGSESFDDEKPDKESGEGTIVLRVILDCEDCISKIKRIIRKIEGMETVTVDPDNNLVVVRGSTMDAKDLALYVKKKFRRNVEAVEPDKKTKVKTDIDGGVLGKDAASRVTGEEKKEADGSESNARGEEIKDKQEVAAKTALTRTRIEERNDGKEWEEASARARAAAAKKSKVMTMKMEHNYRYPFRIRDDDSLVLMFSDENPNSCSVL